MIRFLYYTEKGWPVRARLYGILGSNTVNDWVKKYGKLDTKNLMKRPKPNPDVSKEKNNRRQRNYEQIQKSSIIFLTHWSGFCLTSVGYLLTKLGVSKRFQSAMCTVVHEESESEVPNTRIL